MVFTIFIVLMEKTTENKIWALLALKLNGEARLQDLHELDALLAFHPALKEQCRIMEAIYIKNSQAAGIANAAYRKLLEKIHASKPLNNSITASTTFLSLKNNTSEPVLRTFLQLSLFIAAGLLALLAAFCISVLSTG